MRRAMAVREIGRNDEWRDVASVPSPMPSAAWFWSCDSRSRASSRPASDGHPVNAIMNYAYAALPSQVQIKAVADGYDPMLGVMHYERDGSPAFVFDMMEPERPKVDRVILGFLKSEALHPADFTIREDGVVRVNPQLATRVAGLSA